MTAEEKRLTECRAELVPWKKWGPYLSERQWGTVREDYSDTGSAWDYFTHDQARSRSYRWGEDGIAGYSDDRQLICFAVALWNGADPILKERLFGLTNSEGNHGEDVKEYYFYLDSTPTHSYMKYLYKYPQRPFPYGDLVQTNRLRSRREPEYELIDTGVFDDDRYFDVFIEYAKASPEDTLIRITVENRGPEKATIHVLPALWFRDTWYWKKNPQTPELGLESSTSVGTAIRAEIAELGTYWLFCDGRVPALFTNNETNTQRIFGLPNTTPYVKDGINDYVVHGAKDAVNPEQKGTKAALHFCLETPAKSSLTIRLRLTPDGGMQAPFSPGFDGTFDDRRREADEFYTSLVPKSASADDALIMRQALSGMLWTKQYYYFDLDRWLREPGGNAKMTRRLRNVQWFHMLNEDVISMPDKWEYPWYASWDLAFHSVALGMVDLDFAKQQLLLMLEEVYLHPNGQIPAYEWNFGDVNPPVHAWAVYYLYVLEKQRRGEGDPAFLRDCFRKLLINFTWWVNRKDPAGRNVFEGGFLGLDNIGVFDRSAPLPTGGHLEQADGSAWMALYCQSMLTIAMDLAIGDPTQKNLAYRFIEHFFWIAGAMDRLGDNQDELWDEEDGFFYDLLRLPDGTGMRIKVRSVVGLLPLCACVIIPPEFVAKFPSVMERIETFLERRPDLVANLHPVDRPGINGRRLLSVLTEAKLRRVLARMLDENRFLSPHGIRSVSKWHEQHPYVFTVHGQEYKVQYEPAESNSGLFGGNSNWRGPVWFPVNMLIVRALMTLYQYFGDDFKIECPTGSGRLLTLFQVAREIANRLIGIFRRDDTGRRPVFGGAEKFRTDPYWRDCLLFYEYFHGDNGAGIGASHQTGWTALVARLIELFRSTEADDLLLSECADLPEDLVQDGLVVKAR
jgi:mannosylglycerate hydrolase MGH1-like protein